MYRRWLLFEMQSNIDKSPLIIPRNVINSDEDKFDAVLPRGNSKSTKERCANFRLKRYCSLVFLLHFLTHVSCISADSKQCAPGLVTAGVTWPRGDIILEHGQSLRIYCMLNDISKNSKYYGKNSSDLVFFRNDVPVGLDNVTIVNETTIMLSEDRPSPSSNMYFCRLKLNDNGNRSQYAVVCLNLVTVGFQPNEPKNFICVSNNWENLVCTWEPEFNYMPTRYSLQFKLPGRVGRQSSWNCPTPRHMNQLPPNTCLWDVTTDPVYRQVVHSYTFILTAENALGIKNFVYEFDHFANVIPSEPTNLSVVNSTSTSAVLRWNVPFSMRHFPAGLHHRISYNNQRNGQENWQTIYLTKENHIAVILFNLTDLPHANTIYNVRVSLKSAVAVDDEDKWGNFSEITFKTAPTVPALAPETDAGSFDIVGHRRNRDVYIYWQMIPKHLENGDNFTYQVIRVEEDDREVDLQPDEITKTWALFKGISFNRFKFYIVAVNSVGTSEREAVVRVASQLQFPQKPIVFTKIAFDGGFYELSWNSLSDPAIIDYTIFRCENGRDRPYRCSGYLDWVHSPRESRVYNMTIPDPNKVYQFAIAANTAQSSSGMVWFSSATTFNNFVGKVKTVWVNRTLWDTIEVRWEFEYCGRLGRIDGFNISYCSVVSSNDLTCEDPKMVKNAYTGPQMHYHVIRGLRPRTTYRIIITIVTTNGPGLDSDPVYVTTLNDAGSSLQPKNLDTFRDTSSNSFSVRSDLISSATFDQDTSISDDVIEKMKLFCGNNVVNFKSDTTEALNSSLTTCLTLLDDVAQVISKYKKKLGLILVENRRLREGVLECNEVSQF